MSTKKTIFVAGFVSFIFLNFIENIIHYSIGRSHNQEYKFTFPSNNDLVRLCVIMIIFAVLQGLLTDFIESWEERYYGKR